MAEMIKKRTGNNKAEWSEDALRMLKELATAKVQGRPYSDPNLGYVQKMIPLLEVEPRGKPPEEYFRFQRKKKGMPPPRAMPSPSDGSTMSEHDRKKLAKECSSIYQERASIYDGHDLEREYELREELIERVARELSITRKFSSVIRTDPRSSDFDFEDKECIVNVSADFVRSAVGRPIHLKSF